MLKNGSQKQNSAESRVFKMLKEGLEALLGGLGVAPESAIFAL
jgi:hypothetical protein